jgi:hypothetical protein
LLLGAILAPGKRTVTAVLHIVGLGNEKHFHHYHRVLNRARWSSRAANQVLLGLLVRAGQMATPLLGLVLQTKTDLLGYDRRRLATVVESLAFCMVPAITGPDKIFSAATSTLDGGPLLCRLMDKVKLSRSPE